MTGPSLSATLTLFAFGLACLLPVLLAANRLLPRRARPVPHWRAAEVVAVVATPFLLLPLILLGAGNDVAWLLVLNQVLFAGTAWVAVRLARRRAQGLLALGLEHRPEPQSFLAAAVSYPALFLALIGLGGLWQIQLERWGAPLEQDVMRILLGLDRSQLWLALPIVTLIGPFLEELLFRGFLQGVLAARYGDRVGIAVTAVVFAALHGLAALPMLLGLALFLGWLQARTRSLWVPFAVHAAHNALMVSLFLLGSAMMEPRS